MDATSETNQFFFWSSKIFFGRPKELRNWYTKEIDQKYMDAAQVCISLITSGEATSDMTYALVLTQKL